MIRLASYILSALLPVTFPVRAADNPADPDPAGILRKPVPDKLVVLTFDDGPASHYNVVFPILKELGFKGSFYICDFGSFRTRKDWYMTWRQMKEMADAGMEIGNHTTGHAGAAAIGYFLSMEDALIANNVPKPVTVAWPMGQSNPTTFPDLATNGYIFGRGVYGRAYRPTVDNSFDIPSAGAVNMDDFVKLVRRAAGGKIVVLLYHGVPDIEHPAVSLDPAIFRVQMKYLKDNGYKVIALRDLVEYIDPIKAAALPPTHRDHKETGPAVLASEEVPAGKVKLPDKPAPVAAVPDKASKPAAAKADAPPPPELTIPPDGAPITLDGDRAVTIAEGARTEVKNAFTGSGRLVKNGMGQLRLFNDESTYSGGTLLNSGSLVLFAKNGGIGSGPLTLGEGSSLGLENVDVTNPLIVNGATIGSGNGFGARFDADIVLNGEASFLVYNIVTLNKKSGGISGRGGLSMAGNRGPFGEYVNEGRLVLCGTNTYTGPTIVRLGTMIIPKVAALYHADPARWTAANIRVHNTATLVLSAGGPDEFTGEQLDRLLKQLTGTIDNNGLMGGSFFCIDTSNAKETVVISTSIADSKGPGGGSFSLRKSGAGTLQLAGNNRFTGRTVVESGLLSVASLNSVGKGRVAHSSLGVPGVVEAGEILLGNGDGTVPKGDGPCGLIYTGSGETSNRVINLCGRNSTVTLQQAGTGLLKLTSSLIISGYGGDKQIVLSGDSRGTGELAGEIFDPHDRTGKAKTSITKTGTGTWTLSGANTYSGMTDVKQGTLRLPTPQGLADKAEVSIAKGAKLHLDFRGEVHVTKLTIGGQVQPPGTYAAANCPEAISGSGTLISQ